ncbi:MAG TPA: hypothetical protein VJ001_09760 [Rhodocyclaceae bacterium]|nr:hypothetical protein [Rhodocyclaceae bacterium]
MNDKGTYSLAVNGYLANGGDGYNMPKGFPFLLTVEDGMSETAEAIEALVQQKTIKLQPLRFGAIGRSQFFDAGA